MGPAFLLLTALGLGVGDEVGGTEGIMGLWARRSLMVPSREA